MKQFEYTAQCEGGGAISGTLEATDGDEAMAQLTTMRLRNVELREAKHPRPRRSLGSDDFIFFNEQLASLANSGICLDTGLRQLGKDIQSPRLRDVLNQVADDIERGQSLNEALERHADRMPTLYARVVRAGVESGQLSGTLLNLSNHLRLVAETKRLVSEALTYPAIVLILALGMVCAVMTFVVPRFAEIFGDFGIRLPALTRAMMGLARAMPGLLIGVGIVVIALVALWFLLRSSPAGRSAKEQLVLKTPVLGSVIRNSVRARFLRAMAFSVNCGIPLPEAMRLSADATASPAMSRDAHRVAYGVEQGESVYKVCQRCALIPSMFGYVLEVNNDTGHLYNALTQLSKAYESRAVHCQSLLRGWLAPAAVIGVGLVIALLIVALFMPLVSLIQSVSC